MAIKVRDRFETLQGADSFTDAERILDICTLSDYGRSNLGLETTRTIDPDAYEAKKFQLEQLVNALRDALEEANQVATSSKLFSTVIKAPELLPVLARLIMSEVSTAIKGHGLGHDKRRYVQSERRLSRFHGILNQDERALVFDVFARYHRAMFEGFEVLDTDDVALSLLGRLRTPIWELKRRQLGYDFVFVDETQLFNENERRVLPLLTNGTKPYVPVILALDEAQDVYAQSTAGLATLGIPDITNESLGSIHRSTRSIVRLAFFVIQRSTDLFGPDFPDFTGIAGQMEPDNHPLAAPPRIETAGQDATRDLAKFVRRRIRELRSENVRQIAVICHADQYWEALERELRNTDLPLQILLQRGERLPQDRPVVVLTRPPFVGGQEFDAAVLVGLEQGVVPPRVLDNEALSSAVEQQSLREMYLAITRARYRLVVVVNADATPNAVLQEAARVGLIGVKPNPVAGKGGGF
jgi:superfamily I DNA/RNA helicase